MARRKEVRERYYGEFDGRIADVIASLQGELDKHGPDARLEQDKEYDPCYCEEYCNCNTGYTVWYIVS